MATEYLWIIGVVILLAIAVKFGKTQPPTSSVTEADIIAAIKDGRKVTAIKYYRAVHGVGLKDAKDAVESMAENLARN